MSPSTNLKLLVLACVIVVGVLVGFNPGGMPFIPESPYSDAVTAHWNAAQFTHTSLLAGDYPLWRETIFAGVPFAANPLNKTDYPPHWLTILLPATWHLNTMLLLHLFIGAAGMWAWARRLELRVEAAALASLAFVLAPRVVATVGAGHLDVFYALMWMPWLMWSLSDRQSSFLRYVLQLALVASMVALADVRVSLFAFLLGGAYLLWQMVLEGALFRIGQAAVAAIPFAVMIAALVVPLVVWQPYLSRSALTLEEAGAFSLAPAGMAGLLLPPHVGGAGFETMVYLSIPVLVLALIGLFTLPRVHGSFWSGVIVVAVLWSFGVNTPFWPALAQFEPLRWFRVPARAWLVVVMVAPLLAGYGLQTLMHITDEWRDEPPKFVFWLRLAAAGAAGVFAVCGVTLLTAGMVELPQSAAALMIFDGLAVGAVLLIVLLQRGRATIVALSFIMVTFADVAVTGVQWLEWRGPDAWVEPYADVATFIREDDAGYVYSPSYAIPQEAAEYYGLRLFYGVDPFQLQAFVDVMAQASNVPVEGYSITLPPLTGIETDDDIPFANRDIRPDVETLAQYGVSHVVAAYAIEADELSLAEQINGLNVYRNALYSPEVEPPVLIPPYTVEQTNRVTILSVWVSAVSFVLMGAAIALLSVREARNE